MVDTYVFAFIVINLFYLYAFIYSSFLFLQDLLIVFRYLSFVGGIITIYRTGAFVRLCLCTGTQREDGKAVFSADSAFLHKPERVGVPAEFLLIANILRSSFLSVKNSACHADKRSPLRLLLIVNQLIFLHNQSEQPSCGFIIALT